ncbi:asparaginase domain-containing protein [Ostreibacterium oceani]|uniref:asparaginase n=1 Tax=Ostreibacterium oceani TaxID=2654998 RepID=A0A6N7EY56_9GAMM|nr:asparaginase domain-containing protein [Ostreibacterium oceani]MPV86319.1 asparaginase [Ostreibacterium oceani]
MTSEFTDKNTLMPQPTLIIYTGGTIGMEKNAQGIYTATAGFEALAKRTIAASIWAQMPAHDYLEIKPAIDSADMTPMIWQQLADLIIEKYADYDSFIILHGTDTMAYSASMLSFLLGGIDKPVILTGAQIPLIEPCSDGATNLLVALQLAANYKIPEVCIYFANTLFRGNRASKISTSAMIAFESANYPMLAAFENQIKCFPNRCLPAETPTFLATTDKQRIKSLHLDKLQIAVIYLTPAMPCELIHAMIDAHVNGLVLVSYGSGNVGSHNTPLIQALQTAHEHGIVTVNVSQCSGGHVSHQYAAAQPLIRAGVVNGEDMTIEAAVTKLYYLSAVYGRDSHKIKEKCQQNLRGELTPPQSNC